MDIQQLIDGAVAKASVSAADAVVARLKAAVVPKTWFSLQEAAVYLGIAEPTLCRYAAERRAPKSVKIARNARRFHVDDLDNWIRAGGAGEPNGGGHDVA